jgi:hypothetical protein
MVSMFRLLGLNVETFRSQPRQESLNIYFLGLKLARKDANLSLLGLKLTS